MKNIVTLLFVLTLSAEAGAQITITDTDMPSTGTLYIRDNGGNTGIIDLSVTGAGQNWDYSQLTALTTDTIEYQTVGSTPLLYQFFFNNSILYPSWKADLALPGPDLTAIPNSPITITDVINYYKITSTAYYQVGFGATINGVQASQRYDPRDKLLKLPNTFSLIDSNNFSWLFEIPGIASYGQYKTRTCETDGWGTLLLPNASFNTLRVKSTIAGIDTFYVVQFGFGLAIPSTQYEYRWYANGEGEPVLTVNAVDLQGTQTVTSVSYKHVDPTGIANTSGPYESFTAGPNPVNDLLTIQYPAAGHRQLTISLYDVSGRCVLEQERETAGGTSGSLSVDLRKLPHGLYALKITDGVQSFRFKLVK